VSPEERAAFGEAVRRLGREARRELGCPPDGPLDPTLAAAVGRVAIRRALVALGLLSFTSGTRPDPRCPPG
jgi:hypothetical protein